MESCTSCVYGNLNSYEHPCDVCNDDYSEYKSEEDDIVRDCDNCLHEDVSIFDEPCIDCNGHDDWEPKGEVGKFKVGDIITGNDGNYYGVTNNDAICEVVWVDESPCYSDIEVKVLSTTDVTNSMYVDNKYYVSSRHFKFADKFKVGDIIVGNDKSRYNITNSDSVCEVIKILDESDDESKWDEEDDILVRVIITTDPYEKEHIGGLFYVDSKYFDMYDGKVEDLKLVNLVFVKFDSSRDYLFLVPEDVELSEDEEVICTTRYGKSIGKTVSSSFSLPRSSYKRIISGMGLRESDMKSINGIVKDVHLFE